MNDIDYMRLALDACRKGIEAGQSPFGACIVRDDEILSCTHNHVWMRHDATAHAEIVAIRDACGRVKDVHLAGATIYSTTEPCPMCFSAIHWARIDRIVFGARIADAQDFGFNELPITNDEMKRLGGSRIEVAADVLRDEAVGLYDLWRQKAGRAY